MELIPYGILIVLGIAAAVANERHELTKRVRKETIDLMCDAAERNLTQTIFCLTRGKVNLTK
jgi:hypothetical protein